MIQKFRVEFCTHEYTQMTIASEGELNGFPMLSIDSESYIDGGEIQSGMNFLPYEGRHCIAIGKSCSLATDIVFMIDMNHNYNSVFQGALPSIFNTRQFMTTPRKASIIIQNDVWVGYGVTIMAGVTLHNGCVVAAGSVVTKDVPPYAIVGGNPAKIIRYRFDPEIIDGLQKIAWWDWPNEWKKQRRDDFIRPVEEFVEKYLSLADKCPPLRTILQTCSPAGTWFCLCRMLRNPTRYTRMFCGSILRWTGQMWSCCSTCPRKTPTKSPSRQLRNY